MAITQKDAYTEEYNLFFEYRRTNDKKLRDELIKRYLYIARILSKKFINRGIDYEDIYQVAVMGIIYAVDRFNPERGVRFATYATPTVLGEIRKYFRDKGNFIRVPRALYNIFYRAERIKNYAEGENLTQKEIARRLNISENELQKAYEAGDTAFIRSLEDEANADGTLSISNVIGAEDSDYLMIEDRDFVKNALGTLAKRERILVEKRFYKELSQKQTANEMGISQMHVSRLEKSVLKKLRDLYFHE